MAKTVVILGGSYGGLHIAHYLLKQKIPDVKVILVSKSSHFYWNMASVRAIVPGQITDEQLFQPLTAALERYPKESYEVIIGAAGKVDTGSKTVLVSLPGSSRSIGYDQLVVATGSRSTTSTVPWKILDSYDETVSNLDATRERVKDAKHIVVAGAGATGIEVAGELGCEYGKGKTEVALQNGETITTDLYLPTMGMRANSEMMDQSYLTDKGYVSVDEYYRVKGLEKEGVWALGDVVSVPRGGFLFTQKQAAGVAKNVELSLQGKEPQVVKLMPVDIMACAVGRNRGAGRMGPVKMFSVMVWLAKGKTLGIQRMPGYINGSVA